MVSRSSRSARAIAIVAAVVLTAPVFTSLATSEGVAPPEGAVGSAIIDYLAGAGADAAVGPRLAIDPPADPVPHDAVRGPDPQDPGAPFGYPNDNTFGYTTIGSDLDRWVADTEGSLDFEVNMGNMARKNQISSERDYILELSFAMVSYYWTDADGKFDPVNGAHDGTGDDPCPLEPFKLFTVVVNGRTIRTVEGEKTTQCTPGGPELGREFQIKSVGDDPPYWVRIPKDVVREGKNSVSFQVHDAVLPAYQPYHSKSSDGWYLYVATAMIELAAPPLVLSHGWSNEWDPATGTVPWQPTFKQNIQDEMTRHFGQDPWRWARVAGKDAILLNFYDKKQDFRQSAREMRVNVNNHFSGLGYSGKGWIHGHSMGGLGTRYYVEVLGGSAKIEKLAQTGSPNLGSWEAHAYTYGFWLNYEAVDEDYTAKWFSYRAFLIGPEITKVWRGWRDWWSPDIWAYQWFDGPGHGRDHLADFELKPPGSNPVLAGLNTAFPAPGVQYFTVRGNWGVAAGLMNLAWPSDGAVSVDSADMNGAIPSRVIDEFHETIPARVETARWMIRYWTGLNLDNGRPPAFAATDGSGAGVAEIPVADESVYYPTQGAPAASDVVDEPPTATGLAYVTLLPEDLLLGAFAHEIVVDAAPSATFSVLSRVAEGALAITLRSPSGVEYGASGATGVAYNVITTAFHREHAFDVTTPEPGTWTLLIEPADVPPVSGLPLVVSAFVDSPVRLTAGAASDRHAPGATATIRATLTDGAAPIVGASVTATQLATDGTPTTIALLDDGAHGDGAANDGTYAAQVATGDEGTLTFGVTASGTASSGAFERAATAEVVVASVADLAVTALAGAPADAWGGDAVTLTATVASLGDREARGDASVSFFDGDPGAGGVLLGIVTVPGPIPAGETRVATLETTAPAHALTLYALVDSSDLEVALANNLASAAMPFSPLPRTLATITGETGENGWTLGAATVALGPFDGSAPRTAATLVSVDGAPAAPYAGPFVLADEGAHDVRYWSVDAAGRVEPTRVATVAVDLAAPTAALVNPAPGHAHAATARVANPLGFTAVAGVVDVVVDATDGASGVARVALLLDGVEQGTATLGEDGDWHYLWDSGRVSTGNHVLAFTAEDAAGRATSGEIGVYVVFGRSAEIDKDPAATLARLRPEVS